VVRFWVMINIEGECMINCYPIKSRDVAHHEQTMD